MGQTLTHGIYLPDEGERNCYNGLAANWQLLDGAVGTVAEHTAALAGKAPLVHTHTKADITDFPAYGTTAGTICEGNDSRLSDARTPVAHTHGKADITDLFNSANTWTGENKYTSGFILSNISWSGVTPPSSAKPTIIEFKNSDTRQGRYINRIGVNNAETWIETIRNVDANTSHNFTVIMQVDNSGNKKLLPYNSDADLGQSTSQSTGRWKTLNGINPGALSLPDISRVMNIDTTDWVFNGTTGNQIKINNAVQALNGWLYIRLANVSNTDSVGVRYNNIGKENITFTAPYVPSATHITLSCPIVAGVSANVWLSKQPEYIKFYLSLGEVNNFS